MASISCRCGTVTILFSSRQPRVTTECCCNHCFARVKYLEDERGGPTVPRRPLLASKWDNRFVVLTGRNDMFVYKLNGDTQVVNVASSCCHTFLLGRHPGYDAHCVTTSDDFPIWKDLQKLPPTSRWFANQWNKETLAAFPPLTAIWVVEEEDGSSLITGEEGWESIFETHKACMEREIAADVEGETFDDVVRSIGSIRIVSEKGLKWKWNFSQE